MNIHPQKTVRERSKPTFLISVLVVVVAQIAALAAVPARSLAETPTFNALVTTGTNSSFNFPERAAVGDFNGDGKLDAIVTDGSTDLRLMLGNGNGTFTQHNISVPGTNPGRIKAADLNGDGRLDAVTVSNGGNFATTVLLNTGNDANGIPQFAVAHYFAGFNQVRGLAIGDLNGDGHPDLVVGNALASVRVFLNNGDGTFALGQLTSIQPSAGGPSVGGSVIADVNGDGKADYINANNQAGATNIFFGNGDGTLQAPVIIPSSGFEVAVADVNGDGWPDFLEVNGTSLMVFLNNGDGTFGSPTLYSTGGGPISVTTADINGDGKLDAVVSNSSNSVAVLLGDGSGAFGAPFVFAANNNPRDVSVGDFNGDGKPDIATVGRNDRTLGVLLNTTPFPPPAQLFFTDALTGPDSPNLATIPPGKYGYTPSGLQRTQSNHNEDRPMVFTGADAYLTVSNFTADLTVTLADKDLLFFGLGQGDSDPGYHSEPSHAFYFRVHRNFSGSNSIDAAVRSTTGSFLAGGSIGTYVAGSTITLRIVRSGNSITMSVVGGGSATFSLSAYQAALGLTNSNTRVFFGNSTVGSIFSNLAIYEALPANQQPVADAGEDQTVECAGPSGTAVTLDGSNSSDPDGDALTYTWRKNGNIIAGPTADATVTVTLSHGEHKIELTVDDGNGGTDTDEVLITVEDTTPPILTLKSSVEMWPPNHRYETFTIAGMVASVSDVCDANVGIADVVIVSASSDEPENAPDGGDGNTVNDIVIASDGKSVQLRAERQGRGNGRVYTVNLSVTDASGNEATAAYLVTVPKSRNGVAAIDDGPAYTVYTVSGGSLTKPAANAPSAFLLSGAYSNPFNPTEYALANAFPNPFNPTTSIVYELPEPTRVRLSVFDMLGREVAVLVDGERSAGRHAVRFNAEGLTSGIYVYRIHAGTFTQTRKVTLIK